ncbi:unnamed protein product [Phytophthora lilii]|uniref:Unnamed protein product n=1 Tax=Phytophthora lilii TaxID=2077276 RepID=A0A9W6XHB6_9STRA|nr:unnamed protein product [Phytophthora lilii]
MHEDKELQGESGLKKVLAGMRPPSTDEIHVLVVVPKGAGGYQELESMLSHDSLTRIDENCARLWHKWMEENRELERKRAEEKSEEFNRKVTHTIQRAIQPATPSKSDSQLGQEQLNQLLKLGCVSEAEKIVGADPFWSEEIQARAECINREDAFDAFITPFFSNALDSDDVAFVNSERYKWLSQSVCGNSNTDLKPAGFVTHRGMYQKEPEPNDGVSRSDASFRFGKADKALFDCLVLFESKITKNLSGTPFGQCCGECYHGDVGYGRLEALFRDFITKNLSPWVTRLTAACSALNVEVVDGDAFLGRGAFGRVFKVRNRNGDVLALKIVEASSAGRLFREQNALESAQHTDLTIRPVGTAAELSDGAAMLLSPVGEPISYPTTSQDAKTLFDMLWQLHSAGVVHGDPRVPNIEGCRVLVLRTSNRSTQTGSIRTHADYATTDYATVDYATCGYKIVGTRWASTWRSLIG